jgi:hypothetical protein
MLVNGNEIANVDELESGKTYYLKLVEAVRVINHRNGTQGHRQVVEAVEQKHDGDDYVARIRVFRDRSGRRRAQIVQTFN